MTNALLFPVTLAAVGLLFPCAMAGEEHAHAECEHAHGAPDDSICFNLADGWLAPWQHEHFRNGAPLVHNFGFEPAFLGRDVFIDYSYLSLEEGKEHELELELEWALTRRIGFVLEQGYIFESPDNDSDVEGWGDFAVIPRFILSDCERCIISANLEIVAPTGSTSVEAGDGWRIAPFLSTWCDLGNWWSLTGQAGFEFALGEDETEFFFATGLAKAIRVFDSPASVDAHGHKHELPKGILSVIAELTGSAVVDGDPADEGVFELNGLLGLSYGVNSSFDLRAGYLFPLNAHSELDGGITVGAIHHF